MFQAVEVLSDTGIDLPKTGLPVTIVTGFLGSGKTTLINHILNHRHQLKIAVLVNEFGDIDIDSKLLVTMEEDVMELSNGCICCTINDSLVDTIYSVLERDERVDYLVIETSGIADPLPIALTLLQSELRDLTRLDSILTVLDGENFSLDLLNGQSAQNQIVYGDILLLNKTDCTDEAQLQSVEQYCRNLKEGARILRCRQAQVPLSVILGLGGAELNGQSAERVAEVSQASAPSHLQQDGFRAFSFRSDRPLSVHRFQIFLEQQLPETVYRAKGLLWFEERAEEQLVFQLSGKRFTIDPLSRPKPFTNQLVLIGKQLNPLQLQQQLNNCLSHH